MTGRECLNILPLGIRMRYEENFRNDSRRTEFNRTDEDWENQMNCTFDSIELFIGGGFIWCESREGTDYWLNIHNEYSELSPPDEGFIPVRPIPIDTTPTWTMSPFTFK